MNDPLADLKDIHLPDPVSWWPPAPGWWICLAVTVLLVLALVLFYQKVWKQRRYRRLALQELAQLMASDMDNTSLLEAVASLLRRTAIAGSSRPAIAGLQGHDWQAYLQQQMPEEQARLIAVSRYQATAPAYDKQALFAAARHWIRKHKP